MRDYEALHMMLSEDEIDGYTHEILDAFEAGSMSVDEAAEALNEMTLRLSNNYSYRFRPSTGARVEEWAVRHWDPTLPLRVDLLSQLFSYHPTRRGRALLQKAVLSPDEKVRALALEHLSYWDPADESEERPN